MSNSLKMRRLGLVFLVISTGGAILAVKAQQPEIPTVPTQPLATPSPQPASVLPKLPESQGRVLTQKQYLNGEAPALLALTISPESETEAYATLRLRKYLLRAGQPVLPAEVMSFQQALKKITPDTWRFAGHLGQWQGDIAVVGEDVYFLLAGLSTRHLSLFVYKLDPNVQTKATVPYSRIATPQEKAEGRRRVAQGLAILPPRVTLEEELNKPHWFAHPTDGDKPPLATLPENSLEEGPVVFPRSVRFDSATPESVTIRVSQELENKVNTVSWKQMSKLFRYDLKTQKWSVTQSSAAELAEFAAAAALEKRRELMPDYRNERERIGLTKEEATARIRRRYGVKDWEPIPEP